MNETARILCAIGTTDRVYADRFVENLGGPPIPFPQLFALIKTLAEQQLVTTVRDGHDGIISLNLTELGAERAGEVITGQDRCPACKSAREAMEGAANG